MKFLVILLQAINILVFGHSYGRDCTEFLPSLAVDAGIETLHVGRFNKGNCSLEEHYNYYVNDTTSKYQECLPGEVMFKEVPKSVRQALAETRWDYVVFQTSLEKEGRYDTMQPYLNQLIEAVTTAQKEHFGKVPVLCWNLFWPISILHEHGENPTSTYRMSFYEGKSQKMWEAYRNAAKQILKETEISKIIPSGTAVMEFRASSLNTPDANQLTHDGYHMAQGGGWYLTACTWFESILTPEYGKSVLGNGFRTSTPPYPVLDDATALALQKIARHAARHPMKNYR